MIDSISIKLPSSGVGVSGKDARRTYSSCHRTAVDNAVDFCNTATPSVECTVLGKYSKSEYRFLEDSTRYEIIMCRSVLIHKAHFMTKINVLLTSAASQ